MLEYNAPNYRIADLSFPSIARKWRPFPPSPSNNNVLFTAYSYQFQFQYLRPIFLFSRKNLLSRDSIPRGRSGVSNRSVSSRPRKINDIVIIN